MEETKMNKSSKYIAFGITMFFVFIVIGLGIFHSLILAFLITVLPEFIKTVSRDFINAYRQAPKE